ncbi:MAG TPA: M28 family peptidase [Vicinamibacterales bacterium]
MFRAPGAVPAAMLVVLAGGLAGCVRQGDIPFRVDNARAHIERLAGAIGPRPAGTAANAAARTYLIDQLRLYGYDVRVQEVDATRPELGVTARVANVIATRSGERQDAIAVVAHYDSRPHAPGAMDDGIGAAVALETARLLAAGGRLRHSLVVLLTDAEELGLLGAAGAVDDPELRARVRSFINLESIGGSGAAIVFETGPGNEPLVRAWAGAAPRPRGASYAVEIYRRLPNDTDATILRRAGIPGLNMAPIGDSYAYHTSRDLPDRVQDATLLHMGETAVATVRALDALDLEPERRDVRFSDVLSRHVIVLTHAQGRLLAIVAVLVALVAWVRLIRQVAHAGAVHLVSTIVWGVVSLAAALGALVGAAWLLRAAREVYHPWYASPAALLALLIVCGITAPWFVTRLAWVLPPSLRYVRAPESVWALTLPVWAAIVAVLEWLAPAASHLWAIPVLVAGLLLGIVPPARSDWLRIGSAIVLAVSLVFFLRDGLALYGFLIAVLGRLPIVTPVWVLPAFVGFIGLMIAPAVVAIGIGIVRGRRGHVLIAALLFAGLAGAMGFADMAPAYTDERPQRRSVRYVSDAIRDEAWWEVGGNEPGLDLNLPSGEAARWRPLERGAPPPGSLRVAPAAGAFRFRSRAEGVPAPAQIVGRAIPAPDLADHVDYEVAIVPAAEGLTATLILPEGLLPVRAVPVGITDEGRWRSTYAALPASGMSFRLRLPASATPALGAVAVIIGQPSVPGGSGGRLPAWLAAPHVDWTASSSWILRPSAPVEPPAPSTLPGPGADPTSFVLR